MLGAEWHCRVKGEQRSKVGVVGHLVAGSGVALQS